MPTWDERYRSGAFTPPPGPSPVLAATIDDLPDGRALDVATGTGRNARFLARHGYAVDAVDVSGVALDRARDAAARDGVTVNWIRADVGEFAFPASTYDVITMSFFRAFDRVADIEAALAPGGVLLHEHHLRTDAPVDRGPDGDRYRLRPNDLLRAHLDLDVVFYEEGMRFDDAGRAAVAAILAANDTGDARTVPRSVVDRLAAGTRE